MRLFILFFIFTLSLCARDLEVVEKYFVDTNNVLSIKDMMEKRDAFLPIKKHNLGVIKSAVWIKIDLQNSSTQKHIKRLNNKIAGINLVDVFFVKNNQITKMYKLGNSREHEERENDFRTSYFDVQLEPSEKVEIFIKQKTYGTMDIRWVLSSIKDFEDYYFIQGLIYAYFSGILCVMIVLGFTLFVLFKKKHFLIYALFTIFLGVFQLTVSGFLYQFSIPLYLNKIFGFYSPIFAMILYGLFPLYFFNIQKNEFRVVKTIIKTCIFLLFVWIFTLSFYNFYPDLLYYLKFYILIVFVLMLTLLVFSIQMFILKKDGAIFYLLSNVIYFSFSLWYILVTFGILKYVGFLYYSISIGALGQDIFLALGLIYSVYMMRKENEKNIELLGEYSKLTFIGQTMVNISHQWKAPINNIYNSINHIEVAQEFNDKNIDEIINKNLKSIKETTVYLRDTALSQLNFYKEEKNIEEIYLCDEIEYVIRLIKNEFSKKSIDINLMCDKELKFKIEKNYFLNVLMILFENSFKAFEQKNIKKPDIKIYAKKVEDKIEIIFEDNAQGVSNDFIEKIFEKDFSESQSSGLGLYLAKEILTQKLNAKISVENKNDGLCFKILV